MSRAATLVTGELLRRMPLPRPGQDGDKEERGRVLVIGGSREVPGGALLAGVAALRAGAGKLQIATNRSIAPVASAGRAGGAGRRACPRPRLAASHLSGRRPPAPGRPMRRRADRPRHDGRGGGRRLDGPAAGEAPATAFVLDAGALIDSPGSGAAAPPRRPGRGDAPCGRDGGALGIARDAIVADPLGAARQAAAMLQVVVVLKAGGPTSYPAGRSLDVRRGSGGPCDLGSATPSPAL
jgi:hypothetical protein